MPTVTVDEIPAAAPDLEDPSISSNALESAGLGSMIIEDAEPESLEDDPWGMGPDDFEEIPEVAVIEVKDDIEEIAFPDEDNEVEALIAEGEALTRDGNNKEALASFNKAIAADPGAEMAWFNRGVILEAQDDTRGARQSFGITLDLNPEHGPAAANLAIILDRMGDSQGAKRWSEVALESFPGHHLLLDLVRNNTSQSHGIVSGAKDVDVKMMGQAQASEAAPERADLVWSEDDVASAMHSHGLRDREAVLEEARLHDVDGNLYLDKEELHSAAGLVAAKQAATVEAESRATTREEIAPTPEVAPTGPDLDSLCEQATGLLRSGDARGALAMLMEHLHSDAAQHPSCWRVAAGAMARLELNDNAIDAFTHALTLDDGDASGWYNLGAIHKRKEDMSSAVDCFSRAIALKPDYSRACYALATGCLDIGDVEAAVNAWRNLLTIEPNHDSKEDFGTLLVELGEGEAKVLELAGGLPPTMPEGPALAEEAIAYINKDTPLMARALSVAGKHTESVLCWKELLKVDKENADCWLGLANALATAGDDATAARCRQKYEVLSGASPSVEVANETMAAQPQTMVEDRPQPEPAPVENVAPIIDLPMPEPSPQPTPAPTPEPSPEVDLAKAALDATKKAASIPIIESVASNAIANQDVEWYNKGLALLSEKKYPQALSCFDKALPLFTHDDNMVIRILNARGNCFYYLEEYPKCIENHHKAMLIEPTSVTGATLYNMGTAYGEMERFPDAMKCFEQAIPRGLTKEQQKLAKEQIRRCKLLLKEQEKKVN